ncbi:MAG: hypothetical protein K1563_15320 [Candidatus Thiodiazotropha sp. (ex. Lucinisca nassula)]|nr:hypothetical protein [Candidatus Thiodiazotropha sp. (ex. Lucinisca nassula)]MBW9275049.1 hypothetical protein [Candidatus Thiodiazotropha sp. (ex. Lucinisca nassula)]
MKDRRKMFEDIRIRLTSFSSHVGQPSFRERFAHVMTDSVFHCMHFKMLDFQLRHFKKMDDFVKRSRLQNRLIRVHRTCEYGRPLTDKGLNTYDQLHSAGISTRDLRLAVFANYIQPDGSTRIDKRKEKLIVFLGYTFTALGVVFGLLMMVAIYFSPITLLQKIVLSACLLIGLGLPVYLMHFIAHAPHQAATKIDHQTQLSLDETK